MGNCCPTLTVSLNGKGMDTRSAETEVFLLSHAGHAPYAALPCPALLPSLSILYVQVHAFLILVHVDVIGAFTVHSTLSMSAA